MTLSLLALAEEHWVTLDGEAALTGVNLLDLPLDRFLNTIYHFGIRGGTEDSIRSFNIRLWMPPRGVVPTRGPWSPEAETSAFKSLKAALGLGATPDGGAAVSST